MRTKEYTVAGFPVVIDDGVPADEVILKGADGTVLVRIVNVTAVSDGSGDMIDRVIRKGDYVLATKYGDADPGDHWAVGWYDRLENDRYYVIDNDGKQLRGNGFRRVGLIYPELARWLLESGAVLEKSPPGSINLWQMIDTEYNRLALDAYLKKETPAG